MSKVSTLLFSIAISLSLLIAVELSAAPRKYAPDRNVDIKHVTIEVTPDFDKRTISGETKVEFSPIAKRLEKLTLDAVDMEIISVTASVEIESHSATDKNVTIIFSEPIEAEKKAWVKVKYEVEPKKGLYFRTPEMGYKIEDEHLFTQGQPHTSRRWFVSFDYPNEKFTSEVICHAPADMEVLSNGHKVSEDVDEETGLKVVRWLQDKPHSNYLIALAVGKFKSISDKYEDIELAFYTPSSQIGYAKNSFKDTADMMGFFEREIGVDYPWDKYYQVVVDDFVSGGMENTTLTILIDWTLFTDETENIRSSQLLVSHELVHMWFGDFVTCKDWSHVWLNEGFATYYALLYDKYKDGEDTFLYNLYKNAKRICSDNVSFERALIHREYDSPWEQFNHRRTYLKGAWIVHMLRSQLGEELYRKCIKTYLLRHAYGTVVTENLNSVIEELSGRSFDKFFDQWVFHAGHSKLKISYEWLGKEKLAKVSIKQTQENNDKVLLFDFDTNIGFVVGDEYILRDIKIDEKKHDFYFALESEPNIVRFDPEYKILADVEFEKPTKMLYAQLEYPNDVVGKLMAIESLKKKKKKDKKTVAKLKNTLQTDAFYGVRSEACGALYDIHTDEAFDAIVDSLDQSDARVRQHVADAIAGFYRSQSLEKLLEISKSEKNPEILDKVLYGLGRYHDERVRVVMLDYLEATSYHNQLELGAIKAIKLLKDESYVEPLKDVLARREKDFSSYVFSKGLDALGTIANEQDDKSAVRDFIAGYVNHKKKRIATGAVYALGELRDRGAIGIVETFSGDDDSDRMESTAKKALEKIRKHSKLVPEEIVELRKVYDQMKTDADKLKEEVEDMKKRMEAQGLAVQDANESCQDPNEPSHDPNEGCAAKALEPTEPNQVK